MSASVSSWQKSWRGHQLQASSYPRNGTRHTPRERQQKVAASAVKATLMALSTWADYDTGTNAHPGAANLATATGLSTNVVRWALQIGCRLGWVTRTGRHGDRKADTWALTVPDRCRCGCQSLTG